MLLQMCLHLLAVPTEVEARSWPGGGGYSWTGRRELQVRLNTVIHIKVIKHSRIWIHLCALCTSELSHVHTAGLLKKPWRRGSALSPGCPLVSSPLPPWRGATPRELSSRPGQGVGVGEDWRSQGPQSDQLYCSVWQEMRMRRRQRVSLISTCNFSHVVLRGWKYIHMEPRYLTHLLLALLCCLWVALKQFCIILYI